MLHRVSTRRGVQKAAASALGRSVRCASTAAVERLADAFRRFGHLESSLDPLGLMEPRSTKYSGGRLSLDAHPELRAAAGTVPTGSVGGLRGEATVAELEGHLRSAYCSTLGAEFEYCESEEERAWIAERIESGWAAGRAAGAAVDERGRPLLTPARKRNLNVLLQRAEAFEHFLAKKYVGLKRYSGEGAETMLAAIDTILGSAAEAGVRDAVIGMPHRGRLALLVSLLEYPARQLFWKLFSKLDIPSAVQGLDDVSSHIGQSVDKVYGSDKIHVSLLQNPSHLEAINPVAMGKVRAKQVQGSPDAMALLIHGDSAFSGQGVVFESLAMTAIPGYSTGGTVHIVVNNQVGFTAGSKDARSTHYSSDIAKSVAAPVLHVNAEDAEAVLFAARTAVEYRQRFHRDIVIDLIGYRRYGHNEVDEPSFTQPKMYENIRARRTYPQQFADALVAEGRLDVPTLTSLREKINQHFEAEFDAAKKMNETEGAFGLPKPPAADGSPAPTGLVVGDGSAFAGKWLGMRQAAPHEVGGARGLRRPTGVDASVLLEVGRKSVEHPDESTEGFTVHQRLARGHVGARRTMLDAAAKDPNAKVIDWATAEAMAFGSVLLDGMDVRMSGQDSRRGTFSHRHAALVCQKSEQHVVPLNEMRPAGQQGTLDIVSSFLSEFAVMGFEYGYSTESPRSLTLWEAQFGDFTNGAQIIIDQFLSGGESKWLRQSGLVLLCPHGFDGAGPEHSSARIERYLQLVNSQALGRGAACLDPSKVKDKTLVEATNFHVVNLTTPAQYFHALRRQVCRPFVKPLVVIGPKAILRLPSAVSSLNELSPAASFQEVLADPTIDAARAHEVEEVQLCSGKLYYELVEKRKEAGAEGRVALVRVEELAPFPTDTIVREVGKFSRAKRVRWVQEEPVNAGAWQWAEAHLHGALPLPLEYLGRPALAAPAVGLGSHDKAQANTIFSFAFPKGGK